jgi:2-polyprenyl-3-methyl-5-hydroxy-6-metoxy-1,4-benzoquinol methylase
VAAVDLNLVCPSCRGALDSAPGRRVCSGCGAAYGEQEGIIHLVAGSEGAPGYDPHYFDALPRVENRHFWFLARREVILDAIVRSVSDWRERPLFDIGCGTGGLLAWLHSEGIPLAGACDAHLQALALARSRIQAPLLLVDEGRTPPLGAGQRVLSMFDVLEHIDDDVGVLRWVHSVLEPGGHLALTVPAHPFLFDEMDRLAHHRRRYRRDELQQKLLDGGFEVKTLTHFMAPLVPLLAVTRRLRPARPGAAAKDAELRVVPVANGLLRWALRAERRWLRRRSLPFGSSLVAIARRPAAA